MRRDLIRDEHEGDGATDETSKGDGEAFGSGEGSRDVRSNGPACLGECLSWLSANYLKLTSLDLYGILTTHSTD